MARIFDADPYNTSASVEKALIDRGGFIFHKSNLKRPDDESREIRSTFYRRSDKNEVTCRLGTLTCNSDTTYGVLTIAENPFAAGQKIMVLSGFTGLATCALMELVIESEAETDREKAIMLRFKRQLKERVLPHFRVNQKTPFTVLVKFKYAVEEKILVGDNRYLTDVHVEDVLTRPIDGN